ncbi:quorum-sensing sensor histidine kinase AgrC [Staphylococcus pettenkoferi]|uniref:quorum-sensing sensor histidine kinase AgrC n=1 Tax=Staphylococcus pettenkoferi TaxID=170573 RepID=UPI00227367B6|nr:GHKL domain-containing protein [Staphylococcus pettenkoferi]MCY1599434.1 GHKL domain-containing protein [Staphylococcus pettenkoferi]MCY1602362.1 GHKL domain-containing protein [Staphylococcus pettenkoferi]MCY1608740.1 GHKL domain-containing protein [Staphylococcus pettenkoferi]MCY1612175.1 GHKL domain-containing protein [Staphylococcus pettenkoferi]
MDTLNDLIIGTIQLVITYFTVVVINHLKLKTKDYIFFIVLTVFLHILLIYLGRESIFIFLPIMIVYLYRKNKTFGVLSLVLSSLSLYFSNVVAIWTLGSFGIFDKGHYFLIGYTSIFFVSSVILTFLIRFLTKRLSNTILSVNNVYLIILSIVLFLIFVTVYYILPTEYSSFVSYKVMAIISVVGIVTISMLIVTISFTMLREVHYKRNKREIQNYYEYTLKIEKINNEMRKFRHDYVNILSTMSEFIREDDMEGLRKYFNEEIVPMQDNMQAKSIKINGLENFHVREIKGLLTTKILQAQEKNIRISIEVPDIIEKINLQTIDLSRMIGIILDNAIEASEQLEDEPLIRVGFIQESESVTFIVMNKCQADMPRVHTLFEENFSTKGDNRGLGLSTLKEIAEDNENVLLDTTIENGFFIQKVEILDFEP